MSPWLPKPLTHPLKNSDAMSSQKPLQHATTTVRNYDACKYVQCFFNDLYDIKLY